MGDPAAVFKTEPNKQDPWQIHFYHELFENVLFVALFLQLFAQFFSFISF